MSCIYVHTNKINNKKYIGFSKHDDAETRWGTNGAGYENQKFYTEGILPFGWDNFEHRILIKDIPVSLGKTLEYLLIEKLDLINNGYNEDKGQCFETDKTTALNMLDNLIKLIQTSDGQTGLQTLEDIIDIKYNSTTVRYRLEYMLDLYNNNRLITKLDCQREYVWDEPRQQGMWDTLLYGHRIPEMHAIRRPDGTYEIIDGKQRLLTLMKILNNEIPLKRNSASEEIKTYMNNNGIATLYFKELPQSLKNKIYEKEISVAEYTGVDEKTLVILFQKLNAGKPLSEFQKCIANNIIVRIRYTEHFEENTFITQLFSSSELSSNEDEVLLVRLLSTLNCGDIDNVDNLQQRELNKIIERMDVQSLVSTREKINAIINNFMELGITSKDLNIINKTWYPALFKFFHEELDEENKKYFKDFISKINIPPQRGRESTKRETKERYLSIKKDWNNYLKSLL